MKKSLRKQTVVWCVFICVLLLAGGKMGRAAEYRWIPEELVITAQVQAAYNSQHLFLRFQWQTDQPSYYHDYLVYQNGEWVRKGAAPVGPDPDGLYEDRLSVMVDDGRVKGFANFGGFLTTHEGMRFLDSEIPPEEVRVHPYLGEVLGASDVRHYLPHTREGQWWEGDWDQVLSPDDLEALWDSGVFLDLWQWRAHRTNPLGYWDDGYIFDYRQSDSGTSAFYSQSWNPQEGPQYMFDPEKVGFAALEFDKLLAREYDQQDTYYLHQDVLAPFDAQQMFEGAAIPRVILRQPEGSRAAVRGQGHWDDGTWTVEMERALETGYPDDKVFVDGQTYTICVAVHKRSTGSRWHYTSYPYRLGFGVEADITAVPVSSDRPDWSAVPARDIVLIYPGQITWTFLVSENHPYSFVLRNDGSSLWDCHPDPETLAKLAVRLEESR